MIPNDEVIELLQSLIRNACVNDGTPDSGHEHRSAAVQQVRGILHDPSRRHIPAAEGAWGWWE